jgi:hypothetical protein
MAIHGLQSRKAPQVYFLMVIIEFIGLVHSCDEFMEYDFGL